MTSSSSTSIYDALSRDSVAAAESLSAMIQKEQTTYKCANYLHQPIYQDADIITEADRLKIVDWCYSIVDQCKFDRETVALAMEMMDRYLSEPTPDARDVLTDRSQYQLLSMAALYIAIKTNEQVVIGSDFFAAMSRGVYTIQEIENMELKLLDSLSWRICAPTGIQMAYHMFSMVLPFVQVQESVVAFVLDEVRFQIEYSLRDYFFSTSRPSTVAVAAIFNSLNSIGEQDRQAIVRALLLVIQSEDFDCAEDMLFARNRLQFVVEGNDATEADEFMVHSESSPDVTTLNNESRGECSGVEIKTPTVSPRTASPRSVSYCCRRENVLCQSCISR